ncbi:MAG: hypothetical protein RL318_2275 [Fibrobacterota bacterium]|jgi:membrane protein required for colicin V production
MSWNWVDTLFVACFCIPLLSGLRDGLVAGLLKTGFLLAGLLLGVPFAPKLAVHLGSFLPANLRVVGAFLLICLGCWLLGRAVAWIWQTTLGFTPLGWIDRLLGVVLGLIKGVLFVMTMTALLLFTFPSTTVRKSVEGSFLGNRASSGHWPAVVGWIVSRLPR